MEVSRFDGPCLDTLEELLQAPHQNRAGTTNSQCETGGAQQGGREQCQKLAQKSSPSLDNE